MRRQPDRDPSRRAKLDSPEAIGSSIVSRLETRTGEGEPVPPTPMGDPPAARNDRAASDHPQPPRQASAVRTGVRTAAQGCRRVLRALHGGASGAGAGPRRDVGRSLPVLSSRTTSPAEPCGELPSPCSATLPSELPMRGEDRESRGSRAAQPHRGWPYGVPLPRSLGAQSGGEAASPKARGFFPTPARFARLSRIR
jgi:hypothetical protein